MDLSNRRLPVNYELARPKSSQIGRLTRRTRRGEMSVPDRVTSHGPIRPLVSCEVRIWASKIKSDHEMDTMNSESNIPIPLAHPEVLI